MMKPTLITEERAIEIVSNYTIGVCAPEDVGRFIVPNEFGGFTAIDNSTGDCWTEDFPTRRRATTWVMDGDAATKKEETK